MMMYVYVVPFCWTREEYKGNALSVVPESGRGCSYLMPQRKQSAHFSTLLSPKMYVLSL